MSSRPKRKRARRLAELPRDAHGTVSWTEAMKVYCPESPKRRRYLRRLQQERTPPKA